MDKTIFELLFILIKGMSVVAVFAYLLGMQTDIFNQLVSRKAKVKTKLILGVFFGLLSLIGTYLGVHILDAYANIRAIGAIVGGLIGGPTVGIIAGLIGGLHRYLLGGFTAFACGLATFLYGIIGGSIYYHRPLSKITLKESFLLGILVIIFEMFLVLLFSRPYALAYQLVKIISIPMALSNALGIALFISILHNASKKEKELKAIQAYKALKIANKTLNYLRDGLNYNSAQETAKIILAETEVAAVSIADKEIVLAHCGLSEDHHHSGQEILTTATKEAIANGKLAIVTEQDEIGCPIEGCSLQSAVIAPLKRKEEVIGALKLYKTDTEEISNLDIELARGVAELLSNQLHISSLEKEAQLATEAELKALQAQIHPHFLFNTLNTISSFCRTDPEQARDLLLKLANFFRKTLKQNSKLVTLKQELEDTLDYIAIEKARFGDRLKLITDIPEVLHCYELPSFTLQPVVENALKHGISSQAGTGKIKIEALKDKEELIIKVSDNGVGISAAKLEQLLQTNQQNIDSGIGLNNVNQRLKKIYGSVYGLAIESEVDEGTSVTIKLPLCKGEGLLNNEIKNSNC
ncbi:sensor histidine kinase [Natroniella sulfidigena]|uniref:sensor histidine kinase n=1 Tax=Natroniella sulfidigena TaxID=723921 RepID=UPI00200B06E3|nr:sensor histidine kinase [Natroniella sulfidigena]MCK8816912.1 sensor histidine kinase [Natroniella sulfidigena]